MADDMSSFEVTKEFLEKALNQKWGSKNLGGNVQIKKFIVAKGSMVGDGYTTILLTVDIWLATQTFQSQVSTWYSMVKTETKEEEITDHQKPADLSLVIKCYPENVARHEFLEASDIFTTELAAYEQITPTIEAELEGKFKLPFPAFLGGQALTPLEMKELKLSRPLKPLDNYIMMLDIRKHGGFRLRDRFLGFDLDHYHLVIETQAHLHALSWAFKCKKGGINLTSLYPCLLQEAMSANMDAMKPMMDKMMGTCRTFVTTEPQHFGDTSQILKGLDELDKKEIIKHAFSLYFDMAIQPSPENPTIYTKDSILRIPGPQNKDEVPWTVLLQGDTWSNNMMFRYDETSGRPVQAILLDLQIAREGDPMADIVYALYTGTTREFRDKHLNSMLHVYFDKFTQICHQLNVPLLPGFTWPEFQRRFHRAKIFGLAIGLVAMPLILKKVDHIVDLEKNFKSSTPDKKEEGEEEAKEKTAGEKMSDFMDMLTPDSDDMNQFHPAMKERLSGLLSELTEQGII